MAMATANFMPSSLDSSQLLYGRKNLQAPARLSVKKLRSLDPSAHLSQMTIGLLLVSTSVFVVPPISLGAIFYGRYNKRLWNRTFSECLFLRRDWMERERALLCLLGYGDNPVSKGINSVSDLTSMLLYTVYVGIGMFMLTGPISFDNISFEYPSRKGADVLKNFNLNLDVSESVAIVEQSGSGKSSVLPPSIGPGYTFLLDCRKQLSETAPA
ncbi:hypothetical protein M0805_008129 [Coniferiporia weirii]|nr:hypothetical protein M0805_008129 [Coniferiporia weirii]